MYKDKKISVVIPCFKVKKHIKKVIESIPSFVDYIIVVDDSCPEKTGKFVESLNIKKTYVLYNKKNLGVGGATINGVKKSFLKKSDVIIKIDGDGQMDPSLMISFIDPIIDNIADYSKGNRFFSYEMFKNMPRVRMFGNLVLTLVTKFSTGYWKISDPTNGYFALNANLIPFLNLDKVNNRFFFESDLLFRLNTLNAVVLDIPIYSTYGDEESNLSIRKVLLPFLFFNIRNFVKRIAYNYYIKNINICSITIPIMIIQLFFSFFYMIFLYNDFILNDLPTPIGSLMILFFNTLVAIIFLLFFFSHDMSNQPSYPVSNFLSLIKNNSSL